jgi:hypothetical protein
MPRSTQKPTEQEEQMNEEVEEVVESEPIAENAHCILCESGVMRRTIIKPYNQAAGIILLIVGLVFLVLGPLGLVGLAMAFVGLYFLLAKKDVWLCEKCDAIVERR